MTKEEESKSVVEQLVSKIDDALNDIENNKIIDDAKLLVLLDRTDAWINREMNIGSELEQSKATNAILTRDHEKYIVKVGGIQRTLTMRPSKKS